MMGSYTHEVRAFTRRATYVIMLSVVVVKGALAIPQLDVFDWYRELDWRSRPL